MHGRNSLVLAGDSATRGNILGVLVAATAMATQVNTVRYRYNTVNCLQNTRNRYPIARPQGRAMGCLLWVQSLICVIYMSFNILLYSILFYVVLCRINLVPGRVATWPLQLPLIQHVSFVILVSLKSNEMCIWCEQRCRPELVCHLIYAWYISYSPANTYIYRYDTYKGL